MSTSGKFNQSTSSSPGGAVGRAADAAALALHVDAGVTAPLHQQLGSQLRHLILSRRMASGARLPSSRALAVDLGISRSTVVLAYEQLASEGWIEGRHGAGMFVASGLPDTPLPEAEARVTRLSRVKSSSAPVLAARPFQLGAIDPSLFPYRQWARLLYRTWRQPTSGLTGVVDVFGWPELRRAIARHLLEWRGIATDEERIVITSGTADAVELIARVAFVRGQTVYVEDPGYPALRHALVGLGLDVGPVAVDDDGFDIRAAVKRGHAHGAVVTPSRQFPLGSTLPVARRLELLDWADAHRAYVVEDDFDSEYRYQGSPLPALLSLDRSGRTIYIGSFSKVLSPTLRLGFIVLPERLVGAARTHLARRGTLASLVAQPALGQFIADGDYATHIRRTRRIYGRRMAALVASAERLDDVLRLQPSSAGMHVVAYLSSRLSRRSADGQVSARLREGGIVALALADFYASDQGRSGLLLGFAGFDERTLAAAVTRTARLLRKT